MRDLRRLHNLSINLQLITEATSAQIQDSLGTKITPSHDLIIDVVAYLTV